LKQNTRYKSKRADSRFSWDPVFRRDSGWYFWGEDYTEAFGPYKTSLEAEEAFERYCRDAA
jgi:hypothetical protein